MKTLQEYRTFKDWLFGEFEPSELRDIANHGADGGVSGMTYTSDCVELHDRFEEELWDMLREDAQEFGHKSIMAFVSTFNRVDMAETIDGLKNLVVWYAAEKLSNEII